MSMGGPEKPDDLLVLCPNHHHRQHALIRYLIESNPSKSAVTKHFALVERTTAEYAVAQWTASGSPTVAGWPTPVAR